MNTIDWLLIAAGTVAIGTMLRPKLVRNIDWQATVTPLASIIGSGFLVVVPILAHLAGGYALIAISLIIGLSLWVGSALRYNILHENFEPNRWRGNHLDFAERLSDIALALAYVISIAFYLRLLSSFVLEGFEINEPLYANMLTTGILISIGFYGYRRGLSGLERLELYSVTVKLAIISALLVGLLLFDLDSEALPLSPPRFEHAVDTFRQLGGLLLIVQGFETSLYLRAAYPPDVRARTMRNAQWLAGLIYIGFVALAMPLLGQFTDIKPTDTAIIELGKEVAFVLPTMLILAAVMSQFSAAVADTIGAGGVIEQETDGRITAHTGYTVILGLSCAIIWSSDIFAIVAMASRAFALYYFLQTIITIARVNHCEVGLKRRILTLSYSALAMILLMIVLFAIPADA